MKFNIISVTFMSCVLQFFGGAKADAVNLNSLRENAQHLINSSDSYVDFPLGLEAGEIENLQNIVIGESDVYDRFGSLDSILKELPEFLQNRVGIHDSKYQSLITNIVFKISQQVVEAFDAETAWVTIRFTNPSAHFDIPRWHVDGAYYKPYEATNYKFAAVLRGPGTLFADRVSKEQMEKISNNLRDINLISREQVFSTVLGKGVLFKTGGTPNAAVHSEPQMTEDRIFFSVVPGSTENIKELEERWNR